VAMVVITIPATHDPVDPEPVLGLDMVIFG
jgi:hypothetical protein